MVEKIYDKDLLLAQAEELKKRGFPVQGQALSVEEAKDNILAVLKERGHV